MRARWLSRGLVHGVRAKDMGSLLRPRQWTKNLAVFAAIIFAGELGEPSQLLRVILAFVALCLVSAGLYAANDVLDAGRDRLHPLKRSRPVASGAVTPAQASLVAFAAVVCGVALSALLGQRFLGAVVGYLLIQLCYILWLKNVVIIDMLAIAAGFTLRAVAGAWVIDVPVSPWLVLCTGLLAFFLASAKRRHELALLGDDSEAHRPVLAEYSTELLDSFLVTLSAATITSYALYTFFEQRGRGYAMMMTIPFVIYGVLRYQLLVLRKDAGGRPEDVFMGDRPIQIDLALWVGMSIVIIYVL